MTAADVLASAEVAGVDVYLRPDGSPAVRGDPSPALLAALKEHRAGVIALLGGPAPEPATCEGYVYRWKDKAAGRQEKAVPCGSIVVEAEDTDFFCEARAWCPFRLNLRGSEGPS